MNIKKIALLVKGTLDGDSDIDITGFSGIDSARPGDLTLVVDEERLAIAEKGRASCILTSLSVRRSSKPLTKGSKSQTLFSYYL